MKEGWTYKKFKEVCASITDGDWIEKKDQSQSGIRLVQTGNIGIGEFIPKDDSHKYISEETFNRLRCTEIFEGDILISRLPNPLGRSCILPKLDTRCITAVDCSILRIKKDAVLPKFFVYYTQSQGYFSKIDSESSGTTRARITRKKLEETTIPIPPVSKQILIVERLDAAFAHIDELKANAEKQLTEARALFQKCLTKAMKPKKGWEEKTLKEICSVITDGTHHSPSNFASGKYKYVTAKNIKPWGLDLSNITFVTEDVHKEIVSRCCPQKGDVLYIKDGATTGIAIVNPLDEEFSMLSSVALIRPQKDILLSEFLCYALNSPSIYEQTRSQMDGAAITRVTLVKIKGFKIPVPPVAEQQRIVARLDSLSENVRKYEEIQRKVISECDALKQALLRKVFE